MPDAKPPDQKLPPHHERITDPAFREAVELLDAGLADSLHKFLAAHPSLVQQRVAFEEGGYFANPTLLEFVAENPIRRGTLPKNIVAVARVILDAGANEQSRQSTLNLVATGRIARETGTQGQLIRLLCERGAKPQLALQPAMIHEEWEAVAELIQRGAAIDLPLAAAYGDNFVSRRMLPAASVHDRHLALAMAARRGFPEIIRALLDAGEDPNRFNPTGAHAHSTPLHQAAFHGKLAVVQLLVERGARLDIKDTLWHGTPADWAAHAGHTAIATYLREHERSKA
jgi:hypothetical protein